MNKTYQNLMKDQQIKRYSIFLFLLCTFLLAAAMVFCSNLTASAKNMLLSHDTAIASSLISQGVPENIIAEALTAEFSATANIEHMQNTGHLQNAEHLQNVGLTQNTERLQDARLTQNTEHLQEGSELLSKLGLVPTLETKFLPHLHTFSVHAGYHALALLLPACLLLLGGSLFFLLKRDNLYQQALSTIDHYIDGDYSRSLPQENEGTIYQMFSCADRLATMLQAQKESEEKSKIFLRNTISDISHQLKTPLAALSMYQEIMADESDHPDVIEKFASKTGRAINRMEQLIQSLLKITRLDTGSITFEKQPCRLSTLLSHATNELTTRAANEEKSLIFDGDTKDTLLCDPAWTSEAITNIVKNALDHTDFDGIIRISWDSSPLAVRITISDNGDGIAPEDIYHIFKRFYRSSHSTDTQGIGLGLPLAKSIVEGQGGTISVHSTPHEGCVFTLLFPS